MPRFVTEKGFIQDAAKRRDGRTSLKSTSPKTRGLGYLWVCIGWSEVQGKVIEGRQKARGSFLFSGLSELHASSWDSGSENGSVSMIRGWSFWLADVKMSSIHPSIHPSIRHSGRPSRLFGSLGQFQLGKN